MLRRASVLALLGALFAWAVGCGSFESSGGGPGPGTTDAALEDQAAEAGPPDARPTDAGSGDGPREADALPKDAFDLCVESRSPIWQDSFESAIFDEGWSVAQPEGHPSPTLQKGQGINNSQALASSIDGLNDYSVLIRSAVDLGGKAAVEFRFRAAAGSDPATFAQLIEFTPNNASISRTAKGKMGARLGAEVFNWGGIDDTAWHRVRMNITRVPAGKVRYAVVVIIDGVASTSGEVNSVADPSGEASVPFVQLGAFSNAITAKATHYYDDVGLWKCEDLEAGSQQGDD